MITSADLSHQQARMEVFRKDWDEALRLATVAVDLDPTNREYRALLAKVMRRER
ncbi:MAG: hypothetical protein H6739_20405 [Alphaproteobacteria bacterium]|nr:hypothetical protein [Alphaproteobacteria bacterium]